MSETENRKETPQQRARRLKRMKEQQLREQRIIRTIIGGAAGLVAIVALVGIVIWKSTHTQSAAADNNQTIAISANQNPGTTAPEGTTEKAEPVTQAAATETEAATTEAATTEAEPVTQAVATETEIATQAAATEAATQTAATEAATQAAATETEAATQAAATEVATSAAGAIGASTTWDLNTLDNTEFNFGYAEENRDEHMIPTDWAYYENKWGQFNVDWIQDTSSNVIYLTMDEGFGNDNTITILDTLKEKNVKIVFFLTKYFVDERPELVQRMLDEGHQLGNHSCTHPNMPSLGIEGETEQIMTLHNQVLENYGYDMKLFRFPEGKYSAQSLGLVDNLGYKSVFWSYAYNDFDTENQPDVATSLQAAVSHLHPGAIYLLHANSDTNTAFLGDFIDQARAQGYEFGVYPLTAN